MARPSARTRLHRGMAVSAVHREVRLARTTVRQEPKPSNLPRSQRYSPVERVTGIETGTFSLAMVTVPA